MLRTMLLSAALIGGTQFADAKSFSEVYPDLYAELPEDMRPGIDQLDLQQGVVSISGADASLNVPSDYYYLDGFDARFILSDVWGNPVDDTTLGMLFPASASPLHDNSWALEVTYDDIGYVSDEDAGAYDYNELLETMRDDLKSENEWRTENGYETITLVGWAAEPHYDPVERQLYWAKLLNFEGYEGNTLNYNIRALGRRGVLILNFIASEEQLAVVEDAVPDVLTMVTFNEGSRYADFVPGVDTVAAVGIGGLIAGKVLAKSGMLVAALLILKKFWFVLLIPLLGLKRFIAGRKS